MTEKIAIFRALQLGDMLNVIPAARSLRLHYPNAEISLLGLPWAGEFVKRFDRYFDRLIRFPGYRGLPEQGYDDGEFAAFLLDMRDEHFDLLLQMQGNGTIVNGMLSRFGAVRLAGFHNKECRMSSPDFLEYPEHLHEIERHLALMAHLGVPPAGEELEFPLTKEDESAFRALQLRVERGSYVCIHAGSRDSRRRWPPPYFALLADLCAERGFDLVITGTGNESEITRELIKWIHHPIIDVTGMTTLGSMGVLLRDSALLIANCTGVAHLAAALRTPSLIISMDGEPHRWAALDHSIHKTIDWTMNHSLEDVFAAFEELLPIGSVFSGDRSLSPTPV